MRRSAAFAMSPSSAWNHPLAAEQNGDFVGGVATCRMRPETCCMISPGARRSLAVNHSWRCGQRCSISHVITWPLLTHSETYLKYGSFSRHWRFQMPPSQIALSTHAAHVGGIGLSFHS